jgi:pimeloyl-ACP methyl ester carboxylesterase
MNSVQTAYINALLADAVCVERIERGGINAARFEQRLTGTQAAFLAANFTVLDSIESAKPLGFGFDAVVWKVKSGSPLAQARPELTGQVFVSTRGTDGARDIADDLLLLSGGLPGDQIEDMVNWWLRATTPQTSQARQIKWDPLYAPTGPGTAVVPSYVLAASVQGTRLRADVTTIAGVNGHSLGGHLAVAFARLFPANTGQVFTRNPPGFGGQGSAYLTKLRQSCRAASMRLAGQKCARRRMNAGGSVCAV